VQELLYSLSKEFAVPPNFFKPDEPVGTKLQISDDIGFRRWGPGTGVDLR
jgi:hypothetical protein